MKITNGVFSILLALVGLGNSKTLDCGLMNFRCSNGECISSDLLCDGRANCSDGSDETALECSKSDIVCPEYAFRCNYGACIDGDATCNGIDDCVDRSDELLPRCGNRNPVSVTSTSVDVNPINVTRCTGTQFECNDGQCIHRNSICDGATDCNDKSDETDTLCGGIACPVFTFRCAYGACIDDDLKCNGVINCADGSDETPQLCGVNHVTDSSRPDTTPTTTTTTSGPVVIGTRNCRVPPQPKYGRWLWHKEHCPTDEHCVLRTSSNELAPGTHLVYVCNDGYTLNGIEDSFCGPKGLWHNRPVCIETRCKPLESTSTEADCFYEGSRVSCFASVPPRTEARVSCRNSYQLDPTMRSVQRENVRCNATGHWDPEPITCTPVCGRISAPSAPLIVNGRQPDIAEFPWHATLYRAESPGGTKDFICGATIIHRYLLLTAAHCVYDESAKKIEDASKFYVATGNVIREYDWKFHNPDIVKKANVAKIYALCNYLGLEGNYDRDIAILQISQPFTFSALLRPACLDYSTFGDTSVLEVGNLGKVAGFGKTKKGAASQIIQALDVPYVSLSECRASSSQYERYITIDKFCAGYRNGSAVCDGDSGGGVVFQSDDLWFIRGIVSVGVGSTVINNTRICNSYQYSLYTKISSHVAWIQEVLLKFETGQQYPPCLDKSSQRATLQ